MERIHFRALDRRVAAALLGFLTLVPLVLAAFQEGWLLMALGGLEAPLRLHLTLLLPAFSAALALACWWRYLRLAHLEPLPGWRRRLFVLTALSLLLLLNVCLLPRQIQGARDLSDLRSKPPWEGAETARGDVWTRSLKRAERQVDGSWLVTLRYRHDFSRFAAGRIHWMPQSAEVRAGEGRYSLTLVSPLPSGRLPEDFELTWRIGRIQPSALASGTTNAYVGLVAVGLDRKGRLIREEGLGGALLDLNPEVRS